MRKKYMAMLLACCMTLSFAACGGNDGNTDGNSSGDSSVTIEPQEVAFAPITVDLSDPENRVKEADPDEISVVKDASGRTLTESEWLIGCKFSKSYVQSLGVGQYVFSFSSPTKFGTITLTVTDEQAPRYVFDGKTTSFVAFGNKTASLPKLKKDQDSYQADCDKVTYRLFLQTETGEEEVFDFAEDGDVYTVSSIVSGGVYRWEATAYKGEQSFSFSYVLKTENFDEWMTRIKDALWYSVDKDAYLPRLEDGTYEVDGRSSTLVKSCDFTVSNEIMNTIIAAGKTRAVFSFRFIGGNPYETAVNDASGDWRGQSLNIYNGSNNGSGIAYVMFARADAGETHAAHMDASMRIDGEDFIYDVSIPLKASSYAQSETLLFQYMWGAVGYGYMSVRFE